MQLVRRDADLRPHAELAAVRETRRNVVVDARRVDVAQELLRPFRIVRHNALAVMRRVFVDEVNRRAIVLDLRHVDVQREIFRSCLVFVQCHAFVLRPRLDHRHEQGRQLFVDEQTFRRVADARTLRFRVVENRERHPEIGLVVDIDVADALVVLQHRNERRLAHRADEPFTAPWNRDVNEPHAPHQLVHRLMIEDLDQLNGVCQRPVAESGDGTVKRLVGFNCLLAAAQDHGIAGLEAKRRGVDEDVGSALEDDADDAERHAHLLDRDAARTLTRPQLLADRIGQCRNVADAVHHRLEPCGREHETVDHRRSESVRLRVRDVDGVRRLDVRGVLLQRRRNRLERGVLLLGRELRQLSRGSPCTDRHVVNVFGYVHAHIIHQSAVLA